MNLANMKRSETTEQINLFEWAERQQYFFPELKMMFHVPNEGKRSNGAILKAAGMKQGVPDIVLLVPKNGFHGLCIEMKFEEGRTTAKQKEWLERLKEQGYKTAVCRGFLEAREEIRRYLREPNQIAMEKCEVAAKIDGMCMGYQLPGGIFGYSSCNKCDRYQRTKDEKILYNQRYFVEISKYSIPMTIMLMCNGEGLLKMSLEESLIFLNNGLAICVQENKISLYQAAAVLTVAIKAFEFGKERGRKK